jgi:hypothetical protein
MRQITRRWRRHVPAHRHAGIFGLERLAQPFRKLQIHCGIEDELSLSLGGSDQCRRDGLRLWRLRAYRRGK